MFYRRPGDDLVQKLLFFFNFFIDSLLQAFHLFVQAEEVTERRRRTRSKIKIKVEAKDIHPPVLTVTANQGFVDENSPVGTLVRDSNNNPISFAVSDKDLDSVKLKCSESFSLVRLSASFAFGR